MAWVSVPALIPSDSPDSPAKDEEGKGGRELGPCAVTLTETPHVKGRGRDKGAAALGAPS